MLYIITIIQFHYCYFVVVVVTIFMAVTLAPGHYTHICRPLFVKTILPGDKDMHAYNQADKPLI